MATGSSKKQGATEARDGDSGESDELRPYASPPCYLHELDPSYRDATDGPREQHPAPDRNREPDPRAAPAAGDRPKREKK